MRTDNMRPERVITKPPAGTTPQRERNRTGEPRRHRISRLMRETAEYEDYRAELSLVADSDEERAEIHAASFGIAPLHHRRRAPISAQRVA